MATPPEPAKSKVKWALCTTTQVLLNKATYKNIQLYIVPRTRNMSGLAYASTRYAIDNISEIVVMTVTEPTTIRKYLFKIQLT